jgi:flavin-dependent dehydrogenase
VLARAGARVTMFDASHPREKPCGGGVTGRALALVASAVDPGGFPRTTIGSARFTAAGVQSDVPRPVHRTEIRTESCPPTIALDDEALVVASRVAFDTALLTAAERAGAQVERARVRDIAVDNRSVRLETSRGTRSASFVIGADGANSLVRRKLARPFGRAELSIATGFFAHGITSDEIVIELVTDPPGYLWSFPRPDHLAIGICVQADSGTTAEALRAHARRWIERERLAAGARLEPYSWPIPSLRSQDLERLQLAGPRWCLAGDAAGLVDPITREGIFFALASGEWIADAILGDCASVRYADRVRDEIVPELMRAARAKTLFFRPRFARLLLDALQESAAIRAVMADLIAGRQPYASLKWRLLKTLEIGTLWSLVVGR